jgi:hypothetical protein
MDQCSNEPVAWMVTHHADKKPCVMAWCVGGVYPDPKARAEHSAKLYGGTVTPLFAPAKEPCHD